MVHIDFSKKRPKADIVSNINNKPKVNFIRERNTINTTRNNTITTSNIKEMFSGLMSIKGMDNQMQEKLVTWVTQNNIQVLYDIPRPTYEELQKAKKQNIPANQSNKWVYSQRYKQIVYWGDLTPILKKNLSDINTVIHIDTKHISQLYFDNLVELPKSDLEKMPISLSTIAYMASNEIQKSLADDGIHQVRYFKEINPITIQTTVDEIQLLWDIGGKYRTGYYYDDKKLLLPVIFAVIKGANNIKEYQKLVKKLEPVCKTSNILLNSKMHNKFNRSMLYDGNQLNKERFMKNWIYNYLDIRTQEIIINAMLRTINDGLDIKEVGDMVLNLSDSTIQTINSFEPSENIPKLVIEHTLQRPFSYTETVLVNFLHNVGFDIIILSPMGYRSIEDSLTGKFTELNNGIYLTITDTKIQRFFKNFI